MVCTIFYCILFYRVNILNILSIDYDDTDFRKKSLGIWENDIYDTPGLDWIIGKSKTPTEGTGPRADHTTKKGTYWV